MRMNKQQQMALSPRAAAERKFALARNSMIGLLLLSVINIVSALASSDYYFLFSAFVPYIIALFGVEFALEFGNTVLVVMGAVSVALLVPYLLSWIFSKKKYGWLVVALVYFVLDTVCMLLFLLLFGDFTSIIDIFFHAWVIYELVVGVKAGIALKTLPEEEETELASMEATEEKNVWDDLTPPEA